MDKHEFLVDTIIARRSEIMAIAAAHGVTALKLYDLFSPEPRSPKVTSTSLLSLTRASLMNGKPALICRKNWSNSLTGE